MENSKQTSSPRPCLPVLPATLRWVGVVAVVAIIFYYSIIATPPVVPKPQFAPLDKWQHLLAYGTLGVALAYAVTEWHAPRGRKAISVLLVVVIYGGGIEIGQSTLLNRSLELGDFLTDALGGILSLSWYLMEPRVHFVPLSTFLGDRIG